MNLRVLDFDLSEDAEGVVCWDALAQPAPVHNSALLHEVAQVLDWAHSFDPQGPGALEDGASWDFDLHISLHPQGQPPQALPVRFDPAVGRLMLPPGADTQHIGLSLSLSGTPAFAQAFRDQWGAP